MEKSIFSRLAVLATCVLGCASAVTVCAEPAVTYLDWDGAKKVMVPRTVKDYIPVTSETRLLEDGKLYVVTDDSKIDIGDKITVSGAARLVLCDSAALTVQVLVVAKGDSLTIFGQQNGTGALTTTGGSWWNAGIGGGEKGVDGGTVTINGGMVTANGGIWSAGIGGGGKGSGCNVTINGGTVTARGYTDAAGIGGGSGGSGGMVTINGGTVTATGSRRSAAIGGGSDGNGGTVTINGGTVTATSSQYGAAIGSGDHGRDAGIITITGGTVMAYGDESAAIGGGQVCPGAKVTVAGGKVTAISRRRGAGIGGGSNGSGGVQGGGTFTITGGTVTAEGLRGIDNATIDGGSVKAVSTNGSAPIVPQPTNSKGKNVYCVTAVREGSEGLANLKGLKDYGCKDIYLLDENRLYLYLPNGKYDFSVNGRRYLAAVLDAPMTAESVNPQNSASRLPFDGVLTQNGHPLVNTNATALVRVDDATFDVDIRTDEYGRFAANLPPVSSESKVVFVSATLGNQTIAVDRPLLVPQLPYAFGADYADHVVADGDFTVVDSEVTVLGDLTVAENVKADDDTVIGGVNGGITVGRPLPTKEAVIRDIATTDDSTCVFGIGDPIPVFEADLEGMVTSDVIGYAATNMLYAYLAPQDSSTMTMEVFKITRSKNFVVGTTPCRSPQFVPERLYDAFPGSNTSKFLEYTAKDDGFVTVEINSRASYGGIALTVDFKGAENGAQWCHSFEQGWHRSAWNPQQWDVYKTDYRRQSERPAFNREYVFAMRRGETMHVRTFLQANFDMGNNRAYRMQCPCDIDLHVKVTFRQIGFAE